MHRERLTELRDLLHTIPEEKFNIGTWMSPCGTAGCALGWAAVHPPFVEQGLHLKSGLFPRFTDSGYRDYEAGAEFFGLPYGESVRLFHPHHYDAPSSGVTPRMVADRVQEMLDAS